MLRACLKQHLHIPGAFDNDVRLAEISAVEIGCPEAADHLELRDCIRHSRAVDDVTRKLGEAAILWFHQVLDK